MLHACQNAMPPPADDVPPVRYCRFAKSTRHGGGVGQKSPKSEEVSARVVRTRGRTDACGETQRNARSNGIIEVLVRIQPFRLRLFPHSPRHGATAAATSAAIAAAIRTAAFVIPRIHRATCSPDLSVYSAAQGQRRLLARCRHGASSATDPRGCVQIHAACQARKAHHRRHQEGTRDQRDGARVRLLAESIRSFVVVVGSCRLLFFCVVYATTTAL